MSRLRMAIVCVLCLLEPGNLAAVEGTDNILTFAGSVTDPGFAGDGGRADKAKFTNPEGLFLDERGVLYIADTGNQRIRRVGLDGIIETVAGNGDLGFSGDGGLVMEASFDRPSDVAVDSKGNIYIADTFNNRIRVVDGNGIITTFAGSVTKPAIKFGLEGGFSGDGGPASEARMFWPLGVAVDRTGNVYIGDQQNFRVRKVNAFTGVITTIAGTGAIGFGGDGGPATEAKLDYSTDIAIDGTDIYIADQRNHRIRLVDVTGIITTFASGRGDRAQLSTGIRATEAALWTPSGVAADSRGNVYIADSANQRIRRVSFGIIETLAGSGKMQTGMS